MRGGRPLAVALALLACACPDDDNLIFPANHCSQDRDCSEGATCLSEHNLCALPEAETPYTVVLQASPARYGQTGRYTFAGASVGDALDTNIPAFVDVQGSIQVAGKPIFAEVTFVPRPEKRGYPVAPITVRSSDKGLPNLRVQLPPETDFSVNIQPLSTHSAEYAPLRTSFRTDSGATAFEPSYDTDTRVFALTLYEAQSQKGDSGALPEKPRRLRVVNRLTGRVLSPTIEAVPGEPFVISVMEEAAAEYAFEFDLDPTLPWADRLELPVENLEGGALYLPTLPARVRFVGGVEDTNDRRLPHAEITLVSSFPVPQLPGDLGNRDWCRFEPLVGVAPNKPPKELRCTARRTLQADQRGEFKVELLPGNYEIFISPGSPNGFDPRVATTKVDQGIETQPGGADQGPWSIKLKSATELTGSIVDRTQSPLPRVSVRAVPLGLVGTLGSVSAHNREVSALTDAAGAFAMSVDTGYYDVVATPPADSGYPNLYFANRQFDPDKMSYLNRQGLSLPLPVVMSGTLQKAGEILSNAEVRAYGIVRDLRGFDRAVLLYTSVTDDEGRYLLLLPPILNDGPSPTQLD